MDEQRTADPQTGLDRIFAALRGINIRRRTDDKWIAGVCSGLADRLGVDPVIVRVGLAVLSLIYGAGITLYLVAWALLPNDRNEIAAEKALRDGDGGSVFLLIVTTLALFGGSWWSGGNGWGFPWGLVIAGGLIWWLVQRSSNGNEADQRVRAYQPAPFVAGQPAGQATGQAPMASGPSPATAGRVAPVAPVAPFVPRMPARRSGGPLMALLAIGLALLTYGSLIWLGAEFDWAGDQRVIAMAGSLAAIGLLLLALGLAGWRAGFVAFLAVVLAITTFSSSVVPSGIHVGGRMGDATWTPTSVPADINYRLGAGDGVLDLSGLPTEGLSEARIPAYVGLGELSVVVPEGLTVRVVGHVGLGEIRLPGDTRDGGQGGADVSRSITIGNGPTEVLVDAGVGIGQITVVKE